MFRESIPFLLNGRSLYKNESFVLNLRFFDETNLPSKVVINRIAGMEPQAAYKVSFEILGRNNEQFKFSS